MGVRWQSVWKLVAGVACAAGCGRIAFEDRARPDDAGADAAGDVAPGVTCWPAWRTGALSFGIAVPITELAAVDKQGNPWLTADGRTLYYDTGTGDTEILRAVRGGPGQPFGSPAPLAELSSPLEDGGFVMAASELVAVMSSTRAGSSGFDLWQTARASTSDLFGAPTRTEFAAIDDAFNQFDGFLTPDGLRVYFSSSAATGQVLRQASRASTTDVFGAPTQIPGTGTFSVEADPDLSPDELVLVFSANNPLQLFAAIRPSTAAPFGAPFALSAIVGPSYDADPALSANGCELVFISNRGGDRDLYLATVNP